MAPSSNDGSPPSTESPAVDVPVPAVPGPAVAVYAEHAAGIRATLDDAELDLLDEARPW